MKIELTKEIGKSFQSDVAKGIIQSVQEGNEYPLETYLKAKALENIAKQVQSAIKSKATVEANEYKGQTLFGAKIEVANGGELLDYSSDPEVARLEAELKARKDLVKAATKGMNVFDEDGVIVQPVGVKSNIGEGVKITFK